jgi:hypothetical protein
MCTKLKDTFEFVEKHGSDKQAFLLTQTLKADLSDIEEKIATVSNISFCAFDTNLSFCPCTFSNKFFSSDSK